MESKREVTTGCEKQSEQRVSIAMKIASVLLLPSAGRKHVAHFALFAFPLGRKESKQKQ